MRFGAIVALMTLVLTGCELLEDGSPVSPTPLSFEDTRDPVATCVDTLHLLFERYQQRLLVYDVRFQNDCKETVRFRVSATLYENPGERVIDNDRQEVLLSAGRRGWLCGNGQAFSACAFSRYTNEAAQVAYRYNACYLDASSCSWPRYPD